MSDHDWAKLAAEFPKNQISKKPKFRAVKLSNGRTDTTGYAPCKICGGWHPTKGVIHLDYVGHADITTRLNEVCGPDNWSIEPMAYDQSGLPVMSDDGMWCWMTIWGSRKMCFGDAQGKKGPDAIKEIIGDAIRNGAMRFGVGTYLWSKSDAAQQLTDFSDDNKNISEKSHSNVHQKQTSKQSGQRTDRAARNAAVSRLTMAIGAYCDAHEGADQQKIHDGIKKRPEYSDTAEFYNRVAEEFEQDSQEKIPF